LRPDRFILAETSVPASPEQVWQAWTTVEGIRTFFAPDGRIERRPFGAYEMYFNLQAEPGSRGGEGMVILACQAPNMLSFSWNAPPDLPTVRGQVTHVVVRIEAAGDGHSRVSLLHDGWGDGGEWDKAFEYFSIVWKKVVLSRLKYRFSVGPIDWDKAIDLSAYEEA